MYSIPMKKMLKDLVLIFSLCRVFLFIKEIWLQVPDKLQSNRLKKKHSCKLYNTKLCISLGISIKISDRPMKVLSIRIYTQPHSDPRCYKRGFRKSVHHTYHASFVEEAICYVLNPWVCVACKSMYDDLGIFICQV